MGGADATGRVAMVGDARSAGDAVDWLKPDASAAFWVTVQSDVGARARSDDWSGTKRGEFGSYYRADLCDDTSALHAGIAVPDLHGGPTWNDNLCGSKTLHAGHCGDGCEHGCREVSRSKTLITRR